MATFYLVVFLMMRVTKQSKMRHVALQKYLLTGFINPEELENAILAQHPDMPAETRAYVHDDCDWIGSLLGKSTGSIMSGMVTVRNNHDYAYMGTTNGWKWVIAKEAPDEPLVESFHSMTPAILAVSAKSNATDGTEPITETVDEVTDAIDAIREFNPSVVNEE